MARIRLNNMARITPTLLVDSHDLSREGLKHILVGSSFRVALAASELSEVMDHPLGREKPALLVLCSHSSEELQSEYLLRFRDEHPQVRIAVLADRYDHDDLATVLGLGVNCYLTKSVSPENLFKSLDLLMLGEVIFPSVALALVRRGFSDTTEAVGWDVQPDFHAQADRPQRELSSREYDILQCLVEGASNKVIARKLDMAEATVKVHIKAILRKIHVRNRTQAAVWAISNPAMPQLNR
ncbi:hypothetical protein AU381_10850 [Sinorhizobium glycinis]|uniref:Helix-turn-helix transcriptional regulator n=1 Tax=Sinorhizobium glycinis TaxID=1472378 RepID=A0A178XXI0_9HYPH|nr:response regulator transcription factor [Sinorhizobium glycinis]OAP40028.1 hypothetical protein AU381_10850 [Sinorhizobium glycinis]